MKKNIIISFLGALLVDVLGLLINLICIYTMKVMPLAITLSGGECIDHVGFGLVYREIFSFGYNEGGTSTSISFDLWNFLTIFLVVFIILLVLKIVIGKIKSKK